MTAGGTGLIFGDSSFFIIQTLTAIGAAIYAYVFTYIMLWSIDKIIKVRVSEEHEGAGLDKALHDEHAYT